MLRLKLRRRSLLAETLRELANISAGALVLGQFVTQQPWSVGPILTGVTLWFVLVTLALWIAGDGDDE